MDKNFDGVEAKEEALKSPNIEQKGLNSQNDNPLYNQQI